MNARRFRQDLTITNDLSCLPQVRELVRQAVERGGFPGDCINRLQIAIDEAVTNIVEHGYAGAARGSARIEISVSADANDFRIEVEDDGQTFDPDTLPDIDLAKHVASGKNGGLGVFLIRRIMDLIEYRGERGKRNRLVMVKHRATSAK